MIDKKLIDQLMQQAEEDKSPLICITEDVSAVSGSKRTLSYAVADGYLTLLSQGKDAIADALVHGFGSIVYSALISGDISGEQLELFAEAVAVAKERKKGRSN